MDSRMKKPGKLWCGFAGFAGFAHHWCEALDDLKKSGWG